MQPHEERVVAEKRELDEKLVKLAEFISGPGKIFSGLDFVDRSLLMEQYACMLKYSRILTERITRFPTCQIS
jgi:hypothetical protein